MSEINNFINDTLQDWSKTVISKLNDEIKKKELVLTADLLNSLQYEVLKASADSVAQFKLLFAESGRFKDMKVLHYKKMPPLEMLEEFVKHVGVENFKYVPGYKPGRFPSQDIAMRRIAWGIGRAILKNNITKPKKWFSKPFYGTINSLISRLTYEYQGYIINQIKTELTK